MSFKQFFFSKVFIKQIGTAVIVFLLIAIIAMIWLRVYTGHGKAFPMPDFTGLNEEEAIELAEKSNFRYQIIDSVYISEAVPGSIVEQIPKPGFAVKRNRMVLLTINSHQPEQIILPKITDVSFRQARVVIENCGLVLGKISFSPSEYKDLVLGVYANSVEIFQGQSIPKGTVVDIVIGKGFGSETTTVPDLTMLSPGEARLILAEAILNPGVIIYDETVITQEDSLNARIWKQQPDPKTVSSIELGASVDMWVTVSDEKLNSPDQGDEGATE